MKVDLVKILSPLDEQLQEVELEIRKRMNSGVPEIDEAARYLFDQGGKRIRASMVLLSAGLSGSIPPGTVQIASAVEIVHSATLIHDDIIDGSLLRRGNMSAPRKWGSKMSVLLGDFMYTLALSIALETGDEEIYPVMVEGTKSMVEGELYQLHYSNIERINREHYFRIIELKTARFMAACSRMGAIKGGLSAVERDRLYEFGLNTGYAFQIIDDTLDLIENTQGIGKDIRSDIKSGKVTLPLIYLMEDKSVDAAGLLRGYIDDPSDERWDEIITLLKNSSSIERSITEAEDYVKKAFGYLSGFSRNLYWDMLVDLSNFFVKRNY